MRRSVVTLLCIALLLTLSVTAGAVELPLTSHAALLMEKETGQILYAQNEHESLPPASVTKIMTLLLTMEAVDSGAISLHDTVTVSAHAASMGGSQVFLSEGEQITVEELIKSVAVSSGNDAAVALGEHIAGVSELFVAQMNEKAAALGMHDTHFVNCTGLTAEGHLTSAHDIAVMSRELLLHHPSIRNYTTIWMDTIRDGQFGLSNTNKLIRFYDGATGLKTGYTDLAGYCISATAEREGMELIAVIMDGETSDKRNNDAKTLLNYGFSTYALTTVTPQEPLAPVPVALGTAETVQPVLPQDGCRILLQRGGEAMEQSVDLPTEIEAPVRAGDRLGTMTVRCGGETVAVLPLLAQTDVARLTWGDVMRQLLQMATFQSKA